MSRLEVPTIQVSYPFSQTLRGPWVMLGQRASLTVSRWHGRTVACLLCTSQSYQWRSTSAGEDVISIHPSDPGYAPSGNYYMTVTRCVWAMTMRTYAGVRQTA